jgi:hypothetical protein
MKNVGQKQEKNLLDPIFSHVGLLDSGVPAHSHGRHLTDLGEFSCLSTMSIRDREVKA